MSLTWSTFSADTFRRTGAARRILLEGQRANLYADPRLLSASSNLSAPMTYVSAPAGLFPNNEGARLTEPLATARHSWGLVNSFSVNGTSEVTLSCVLRKIPGSAEARFPVLYVTDGGFQGPTRFGCVFDVNNTGVSVGGLSTAGATFSGSRIEPLGGGLFRLQVAGIVTNDIVVGAFLGTRTVAAAGALGDSYAGDGASGYDVWGWQVEQGPFASSIILPPVGTPAASTRGADLPTVALARLGIGSGQPLALYGVAMMPQVAPVGATQRIVQIDGGDDLNFYALYTNQASTAVQAVRRTAGVISATTPGNITPGLPFAWGFAVDPATGAFSSCIGAGAVQTGAGGPNIVTRLRFNADAAGGNNMNGEIGWVSVRPGYPNAAEMQARVAALPLT